MEKTKMTLTCTFEECEEGGFIAYFDELPYTASQGLTKLEAFKDLCLIISEICKIEMEILEKEGEDAKDRTGTMDYLPQLK